MVVLITGASGGLGSVLGQTLTAAGMTVYGTARDPGPALQNGMPMLALDVTSTESVRRCIQELHEREGRIDVVINCVNQMILGSTEETSPEELSALYDVNVFGVHRVCQAILPIFKKQGAGTLVHMSSLGGLLAVPYMGAYTSAKFALEAMSEALYHELKSTNIDVVIMQPVAMHMDRPPTGSHLKLSSGVRQGSRSHAMLDKMAADTAASVLTPERVSAKILEVIQSKKKPLRVPMDKAKALSVVKRLAPQALIDKLIAGLLHAANPTK